MPIAVLITAAIALLAGAAGAGIAIARRKRPLPPAPPPEATTPDRKSDDPDEGELWLEANQTAITLRGDGRQQSLLAVRACRRDGGVVSDASLEILPVWRVSDPRKMLLETRPGYCAFVLRGIHAGTTPFTQTITVSGTSSEGSRVRPVEIAVHLQPVKIDVRITAWKKGFQSQDTVITLPAIRGHVRGNVQGGDSAAVLKGHCTASLRIDDGAWSNRVEVRTSVTGAFSFGLPPRLVQLYGDGAGAGDLPDPIRLDWNEEVRDALSGYRTAFADFQRDLAAHPAGDDYAAPLAHCAAYPAEFRRQLHGNDETRYGRAIGAIHRLRCSLLFALRSRRDLRRQRELLDLLARETPGAAAVPSSGPSLKTLDARCAPELQSAYEASRTLATDDDWEAAAERASIQTSDHERRVTAQFHKTPAPILIRELATLMAIETLAPANLRAMYERGERQAIALPDLTAPRRDLDARIPSAAACDELRRRKAAYAAARWTCPHCSWPGDAAEQACPICGSAPPAGGTSRDTKPTVLRRHPEPERAPMSHLLLLPAGMDETLAAIFPLVARAAEEAKGPDSAKYEIVLRRVPPGARPAIVDAVRDVRQATRHAPGQAERLVAGPPSVICHGLPLPHARAIGERLEQLGAIVEIRKDRA